jgi:hypothetical protein
METHGRPPDLLKLVTCVQSVETLVWDVPAGSKVVREWREEGDECMLSGRDSLAAVAVQGHVYALGGYNGSIELSSVESHQGFAARQHPSYQHQHHEQRSGMREAAQIGGQSWRLQPSMRKRRSHLGAAVVGNRLFAIGGFNGTHDLPNTEFLRLHSSGEAAGTWQWGPTMTYKRTAPAVVSLAGKLYAFGGYDGHALTASSEEMHVRTCSKNLAERLFSITCIVSCTRQA